jgi:3-deoxy-D-manno-octulosonic-acid transferase
VRLGVFLVPHVLRSPLQREAHARRLGAAAQLIRWASVGRDAGRPLAWFHAPSVGEGLQARAVIQALRAHRPELQVAYTHFSPSAERFAATIGADVHGYLPYDILPEMVAVLEALRPDLLVFAKLDLWPNLATEAARRGVRTAVVAGTVRPDSGRLRWPAASLTRSGYAALDLALAIEEADAERLVRLGVHPDRVHVVGDPRLDSAIGVIEQLPPEDPLLHVSDPEVTLVAGSTWPEDEHVLLEAFAVVRETHPVARLMIVPHEPTPDHLAALDAAAVARGLPHPVRLDAADAADAPLLVVDRMGLLARLYANGGITYVGGGFGERGIHSVVEPAAWQRPVVVGPRDRGAREVRLMRSRGGLVQLPAREAARALATQWQAWLEDAAARQAAGAAALEALAGDRGAAGRTAVTLLQCLPTMGGELPGHGAIVRD